ncbi:MAG: hypothetical protein ACK5RS_14110, partial [Acidobacteriota bacterium]
MNRYIPVIPEIIDSSQLTDHETLKSASSQTCIWSAPARARHLVRAASPAVLVTVRFDPPAAGAPFSQRKIFGCWQPDRLIFNHRA